MKKIFSASIDTLATNLEAGARADFRNTQRFIEPAQGTLQRAQNTRHHIVFGRRGSGKSSLLFKSAEDLASNGFPIAFIDLEPYKGHQYPDIIISVLIATLDKIRNWVQENIDEKPSKNKWFSFFKRGKRDSPKSALLKKLESLIKDLYTQLYLADNATLLKKQNDSTSQAKTDKAKGSISVPLLTLGTTKTEGEVSQSSETSSNTLSQEEFRRSKKDYLLRKILDFQDAFQRLYQLTQKDCYLFLDDLYHILRRDQASLIDYFHRISKGNKVWLKIGTIRNRTNWYRHSPQPIGLKLGDDADEINLDLTLEKFSLSKAFLSKILEVYIQEADAPNLKEFVADTGLDRLVLSSGGVARDFLGLFRKSILETRERLTKSHNHHRGDKIGAEDVNIASGEYGQLKKEEFQRDTLEDQKELEEAFEKIKWFCLDQIKKNVFLVDVDSTGIQLSLLDELIDLRLVHQIKSRVTVGDRPGKVFKAYILDVSQHTGERARRDVEMVDFWKEGNKGKLRLASLIYNPNVILSDLSNSNNPKNKRHPTKKESKKGKSSSSDSQQKLF